MTPESLAETRPRRTPRFFETEKRRQELERKADELGIGLGELIHALTDQLGIEQCPRCMRWQVVVDRLRIVGWRIKWRKVKKQAIETRRSMIKIRWSSDA